MTSWINRRIEIIERIGATLRKLDGKEINEKEFALAIAEEYNCSIRTAREYLKVGLLRHGKN